MRKRASICVPSGQLSEGRRGIGSVGDDVGEGTAAHLEDRLPAATNTHVPTYSNKHTPACPQQ